MSFSLLGFLDGIVQSIIHWFYSLLWSILMWFKDIFDFCYTLVRKLAGIDTYWYNGQQMGTATSEGAVTGDVVEAIIRSDVVRNIFISVLVLGIILLFIVTFISVWKTEWEFGKEGNSKGKIITASLKALFNFIAVPVIAMFGIFVGNALLRAIDSATAGGENVLFTDMIMTSVASNALRADYMGESVNSKFIEANRTSGVTEGENGEQTEGKAGIYYYFSNAKGDIDTETILYYFRNQVTFTGKNYQLVNNEETGGISSIDDYAINNKLDNGTLVFTFSDGEIVDVFFDTSKINYLLAFMVMFFMLKSILTITYGLVKRFFFVVILFIVSPPVVAVTPINSKALDEWRKQFVGHLTNAYVTIGLFNIFMSIFPIFEKIQFFAGGDTILNNFATLLMVAVGMLSLNEIIKTINEIFFGKGFDLASQSSGGWNKAFSTVGGAFKPMTGVPRALGAAAKFATTKHYEGWGAAFKGLGKDALSAAKKVANTGPLADMWKGANVAGSAKDLKEAAKSVKKNHGASSARRSSIKGLERDVDAFAEDLGYGNLGKEERIAKVQEDIKNDESRKLFAAAERSKAASDKFLASEQASRAAAFYELNKEKYEGMASEDIEKDIMEKYSGDPLLNEMLEFHRQSENSKAQEARMESLREENKDRWDKQDALLQSYEELDTLKGTKRAELADAITADKKETDDKAKKEKLGKASSAIAKQISKKDAEKQVKKETKKGRSK